MLHLGTQYIIEIENCDNTIISQVSDVEKILLNATRAAKTTIITYKFHQFNPYGVSGVVILAQSHSTVHTWPEYNYAAIDMFFCTDNIDINAAIESLKNDCHTENIKIKEIYRKTEQI